MTLDWSNFTPWSSLAGGIVLGVASALFVLMNGRILGISGIIGGLVKRRPGDSGWRIAFVLGLLAAPAAWSLFAPPAAARIDAGWLAVVAAGLLVGVGTRYGAGCTSGHGVCGMSRLSPRSLVATGTFMAAGFAMVYVIRHLF